MRRALALAVLIVVGLAGCDRKETRAPFTDSRIPPGLEQRFYPPEGWAWGTIDSPGAPLSRYGVAAPPYRARGHILILPGYGESAETWFETARDLTARGQIVWILDPVGQGGSGRLADPRDLGHTKPGLDVAALRRMMSRVSRERPLTVLAHGSSATTALLAIEQGARIDRLVLSAPTVAGADASPETWVQKVGLGTLRAHGGAWRREAAVQPGRAGVQQQWQLANPDLRMGGPSQGWVAVDAEAGRKARAGLLHVKAPTLVISSDDQSALCRQAARCENQVLPGLGAAPHLAADGPRRAWLTAIAGPPDPDRDGFSSAPVEARVDW